jgi:hypothetical protein
MRVDFVVSGKSVDTWLYSRTERSAGVSKC